MGLTRSPLSEQWTCLSSQICLLSCLPPVGQLLGACHGLGNDSRVLHRRVGGHSGQLLPCRGKQDLLGPTWPGLLQNRGRVPSTRLLITQSVCLSQVLIGPGAELDPAMGVQGETQSLALKTKLRGDQIGDLHRR